MTIVLTKSVEQSNAITHAGLFHADDVFASVFLERVFGQLRLFRTFDVPKDVKEDVLVFDIGGGEFDHHQKEGNGMRRNGIKYASFGLLWRKYGRYYLRTILEEKYVESVWRMIDGRVVQPIDAADCGQYPKSDMIPVTTITSIIRGFNPKWDEEECYDERFIEACDVARVIFDNALRELISNAKAQDFVNEAISKCAGSELLVLERFAPWQKYVFLNPVANGMKYIIFPSMRGYNVQVIPIGFRDNNARKPFPAEWNGLKDEDFRYISGVEAATFCHPDGFIAGAKTLEGAVALANKALES